jgi:hypothetical protein
MIIEFDKVSRKSWDETMKQAEPKGTIFQSTYWAECLKNTLGSRPIYMAKADERGNVEGQLLAFENCYAEHSSSTMPGKRGLLIRGLYRTLASPVLHRVLPFIFWENGPVVLPGHASNNSDPYGELLEAIVQRAKDRKCYEIKFARPAFFDDRLELFSSLGFANRRMGTVLVNLEGPIETIWSRLESETRRLIRRTQEKGISITRVNRTNELEEFYEMHVQTTKRTGGKTYSFLFFKSLHDYLSRFDKTVTFVARLKDRPIGALMVLMHNDIVHIYSGGESDYARQNKIKANHALLWHIIEWAREMGFKYFDQSGVELHKIESNQEKAKTICWFKAKWGGQIPEYHDYQKTLWDSRTARFLNHLMTDPVVHN